MMHKLGLMCALLAGSVWAAEVPQRNLVNFEAVASREVGNDLATATLFVELSDTNPARLAEKVNLALSDALKALKQYPAVQSAGTTYATYPVYGNKNNKQEGWRSRGELQLTSQDFSALSQLIGDLQGSSGLQLAGVRYSVSDAAKSKAEALLIEEGITAFKRRATLIQRSMSAKDWKLVNMNINTGYRPEPRPMMMRSAPVMDAAMAAAPAPIESGESRVQVNVNGSIQLGD
ncbi:SIMPL domain-containing protein [Deefgea salmonis]|uniref:SIMPL domain-containing protein n=1 Tax=Deefgea salmonis TaxID=2875502 RepID=A0ABS8BHM8_9NEIS|nr:SIMPL domain-containing protein [Deefgea salmonis]MCB5195208.1 SIMPL domain-containing protein [Deefgea salmonis]